MKARRKPKPPERKRVREIVVMTRRESGSSSHKPIAYTPAGKPVFAYNANGVPCCGAKKKRVAYDPANPKTFCGMTALYPNGRCINHGGKSVAGPLHPSFTHGRFSVAMPAGLRESFNRYVKDPMTLSNHEEAALLAARIDQLLGKLEGGLDDSAYRLLRKAIRDAEQHAGLSNPDPDEEDVYQEMITLRSFLKKVAILVKKGENEIGVWRELKSTIEVKRRLSETEARRAQIADQMITKEQAMAFTKAVLMSVQRHVKPLAGGQQALIQISLDVEKMMIKEPNQDVVPTVTNQGDIVDTDES